jgi:hypothetical protein
MRQHAPHFHVGWLVAAHAPFSGSKEQHQHEPALRKKEIMTSNTGTRVNVKNVIVGPGPCDLNPSSPVHLSWRNGDQIGWAPSATSKTLTVIFRRSGFPPNVNVPPFANMTQDNHGDWIAANPSGPINPGLKPLLSSTGPGLEYDYVEILGGTQCPGPYGRIIIDW